MAGTNGQGTLRDRVKAVDDMVTENVAIPEWGDVVFEIRSMTGLERAQMLKGSSNTNPDTGEVEVDFERVYPEIIIATSFDPETGEKAFGPDDRGMLNGKNAAALERLASVGLRLSGLDKKAREKAAESFPV